MQTIGVLGGLGPQATLDFIHRLHRASQRRVPPSFNRGYPPIAAYWLTVSPMAVNENGEPIQPLRPAGALLAAAQMLGGIADFLVIPSNTPYLFAAEIEATAGKPLLPWADITVEAVVARHPGRVGIMAAGMATPTYHALYESRLSALGVPWVGLPTNLALDLDRSIFAVMEGHDPQRVAAPARAAVAWLRTQGADTIVLGCTEIPLLLGETGDPDLVNPAQLVAEVAVGRAVGTATGAWLDSRSSERLEYRDGPGKVPLR